MFDHIYRSLLVCIIAFFASACAEGGAGFVKGPKDIIDANKDRIPGQSHQTPDHMIHTGPSMEELEMANPNSGYSIEDDVLPALSAGAVLCTDVCVFGDDVLLGYKPQDGDVIIKVYPDLTIMPSVPMFAKAYVTIFNIPYDSVVETTLAQDRDVHVLVVHAWGSHVLIRLESERSLDRSALIEVWRYDGTYHAIVPLAAFSVQQSLEQLVSDIGYITRDSGQYATPRWHQY